MRKPTVVAALSLAVYSAASTGALHAQESVSAPPAEESAGALEEIIVTANKRAEHLQDVPISVTAVSAETLQNSGVENVQDLRAVVPGLNVTQNTGFENTHLRGVGSSILGPGLENPIALYVDGVYYASTSSSLIDFVDVADVQVLKGPQGTLFGRNATGGLIQITTKAPTQEFHADADVTYGNYNTSKASVYLTGGIAADVAADFAAQYTRQGDGYGTNLANNQDVYQDVFDGTTRSKWVYTPSEETRLTAIFDFSRERNSDIALTLNPGTTAVPAYATYRFSNPWDTDTDVQPLIDNKGGGVSLRLDQSVGIAQLSNLLAFRQSATELNFDLDFTPIAQEGAFLYEKDRQLSEELQLASNADSRIHWVIGAYLFDAGGEYVSPSTITLGETGGIALTGNARTKSVAGFTQATTEVLPATNLTLGVRYTHEDRDLLANQFLLSDGVVELPLAASDKSEAFARPTYRAAVDHRFSDATLAYVSFNTGFKSGGWNTQVPQDPAFKPETLKAFEVGIKNDLFDRRLRADLAAFYYDYYNIQEQHLELISSGVINGPPAHLYGTDLDIEARITPAFRLGAGFEYLHARFVGDNPELPIGTPGGGVPLVSGSVDGNQLPLAPNADLSLTADYTFLLLGGETDANATYEHNSGFYLEPDNMIHQSPYNQLNLSVRWVRSDSKYSVRLWCNNVTDVAVITQGTTQVTGVQDIQYAAPRTYGVTVGLHL